MVTSLSVVESQSDVWITRKMGNILWDLIPLEQRSKATQFLNSAEDVDMLGGLVEDIRDAMMDYQVCPQSSRSHLS